MNQLKEICTELTYYRSIIEIQTILFAEIENKRFLIFSFRKLGKMVKLTADLIHGAAQYTNPIRERELDLSGKL